MLHFKLQRKRPNLNIKINSFKLREALNNNNNAVFGLYRVGLPLVLWFGERNIHNVDVFRNFSMASMTSMNVIIFSHPCRKESGSLVWFAPGSGGCWGCRTEAAGRSQCCTTSRTRSTAGWRWFHWDTRKRRIPHWGCTCRRTERNIEKSCYMLLSQKYKTLNEFDVYLTLSLSICVDSRSILTGTVEASVRNTVEHWIVHSSFSRDGSHLQTSCNEKI